MKTNYKLITGLFLFTQIFWVSMSWAQGKNLDVKLDYSSDGKEIKITNNSDYKIFLFKDKNGFAMDEGGSDEISINKDGIYALNKNIKKIDLSENIKDNSIIRKGVVYILPVKNKTEKVVLHIYYATDKMSFEYGGVREVTWKGENPGLDFGTEKKIRDNLKNFQDIFQAYLDDNKCKSILSKERKNVTADERNFLNDIIKLLKLLENKVIIENELPAEGKKQLIESIVNYTKQLENQSIVETVQVSRDTVPINLPSRHEPVITQPEVKPVSPGNKPAPSQEIITSPPGKKVPYPQKDFITEYTKKYEEIRDEFDSIKEKETKLKISDKEKATLSNLLSESTILLENTKRINVTDETKGKKENLLKQIRDLKIEIAKFLAKVNNKVDPAVVIKDYSDNVYQKHNAITAELEKQKSYIDALISKKEKKSELIRWINNDSIQSSIDTLKSRISEGSKSYNLDLEEFIKRWDYKETSEILEGMVSTEIKDNYEKLNDAAGGVGGFEERLDHLNNPPYVLLITIAITLILILAALIFYIRTYFNKKALRKYETTLDQSVVAIDDEEATTITYASGLAEVKENVGKDYYAVNMNALFIDTAIQTVYISRKCIQDIYRFFSSSLEKSGKVNESGCFAIGRWEYASPENKDFYNISLEEIILPGNDAVYGEFTLDFGVQIGISLESKIIEVRQNTGKDYVHTSWIHSHPGLGLFLSAHDLIVQSQLLYREHPNRLLAIVIDNNTENLNMALFSPKKDGNMNNKDDLKKKLFLEDIYQWARKPPGTIVKPSSDYFQYIVGDSGSSIKTILFSGAAIINMDRFIEIDSTGLIGYFYGNPFDINTGQQSVVIEKFQPLHINIDDNENKVVGCLLVESKFSYQQILDKYEPIISRYDFFAVYLSESDSLNIIVRNNNHNFPDTEDKIIPIQLIEMKKWTRRKR